MTSRINKLWGVSFKQVQENHKYTIRRTVIDCIGLLIVIIGLTFVGFCLAESNRVLYWICLYGVLFTVVLIVPYYRHTHQGQTTAYKFLKKYVDIPPQKERVYLKSTDKHIILQKLEQDQESVSFPQFKEILYTTCQDMSGKYFTGANRVYELLHKYNNDEHIGDSFDIWYIQDTNGLCYLTELIM